MEFHQSIRKSKLLRFTACGQRTTLGAERSARAVGDALETARNKLSRLEKPERLQPFNHCGAKPVPRELIVTDVTFFPQDFIFCRAEEAIGRIGYNGVALFPFGFLGD